MPPPDRPDHPRIVITGMGLVTPLGHSAWATFAALLGGQTLTSRAARLPPDLQPVDLVRALGCVSIAQHTGADPSITLAELAAREAIFQADTTRGGGGKNLGFGIWDLGFGGAATGGGATTAPTLGASPAANREAPGTPAVKSQIPNPKSQILRAPLPAFIGASKGAMHALTGAANRHGAPIVPGSGREFLAARRLELTGLPGVPPADADLAVTLGPHGYLAHHLRQRLGLAEVRCTVAACASGLTALHHARLALLHEAAPRVLVVTSEAALLPLFIHSYARLGVLPPLTTAGYRGLPLDRGRCGFMLAELGAAVVLERVDRVGAGQTELVDTAVAADSFDLIRPAPGMAALDHIAGGLLPGRSIDVLHPHATGTVDNDPAELAAYARHVGGAPPPDVYANKGALGHGLGASGLASLVLACLCAHAGRRPPMPWLDGPCAAALPVTREPPAKGRPMRTHAVFAAGFGGHVAGAVVRRAD